MQLKAIGIAFLCMHVMAGAAITVAPCDSDTLGFYPFNDHPVGTVFGGPGAAGTDDKANRKATSDVFSNVVASVAGATGHFTAFGASPTAAIIVTNDVPGRYVFPSKTATTPIAADVGAVFHGGAQSGLQCSPFAKPLTGLSAHTIEFFVKQIAANSNCYWFYADYGNGDNVNRPYVRWLQKNKIQLATMGSSHAGDAVTNLTGQATLADGRWHHVALVYSDAYGDDANYGGMRLYLDYEWVSGTIRTKPTVTTYGAGCRLGSLGETGFGGLTSALRVTKRALTPDEFMRASDQPCGATDSHDILFTLSERPVGTRWTGTWGDGSWDNAPGFYGQHYTNTFIAPVFVRNNAYVEVTDDVPGRYLYPSLTATSPIVSDLRSLHFAPVLSGGNTNRAMVALKYVGNYIARQPRYTVEFFWKARQANVPLDLAYWDVQAGNANQRLDIVYTSTECMSLGMLSNGTWSDRALVDYTGEAKYMVDGRWHHVAAVYDDAWGENGGARIYCDYGRTSSVTVPAVRDGVGADNLQIGSSSYDGYVTAVRVTPDVLTPDKFLYASDCATGVLPPQALVWPLDGIAGTAVSAIANTAALSGWTNQYAYASANVASGIGTGVSGSVYSDDRVRGTRITGFNTNTVNRASVAGAVRTAGYGPLVSFAHAFTAVSFVKANAYPASGEAALMGVEDSSNGYSWCLAVNAAGQLVLRAKLAQTTATTADYALETGATLPLNAWTRLVVVCDGDTRTFKVYRDVACVKTGSDWAAPLAFGDGGFVIGAGCGLSAFDGWIDEVAFVRETMSPDDFPFILTRGLMLIVR